MLEKKLELSKTLSQQIDRVLASLLLLKSRSQDEQIFARFLEEIQQLKAISDQKNLKFVFESVAEMEKLLLSIKKAKLSLTEEVFFSLHQSLESLKSYINPDLD